MTGMVEYEAKGIQKEIAALMASRGATIEAGALAIADTLAVMAAQLDRDEGKQSLSDRLHAFCARVEQTYNRIRGAR